MCDYAYGAAIKVYISLRSSALVPLKATSVPQVRYYNRLSYSNLAA